MWGVSFAGIIPPLVNAVQIQVMNAFYGTVAIKLTDLVRSCGVVVVVVVAFASSHSRPCQRLEVFLQTVLAQPMGDVLHRTSFDSLIYIAAVRR